jgi:PAS domain S-box-containing protein
MKDADKTKDQLVKELEEVRERLAESDNLNIKYKRMGAILQDSELSSRAWLEHSPVCTKIVDLDFNLQYMSAAGIKSLNIDDITLYYGKPYPFDFYPEPFRSRMLKNLKKVRKTGEFVTQEASVADIKGTELWFHSTLVPVNDDKGQLDYIIVVSIDITERKRAEEELRLKGEIITSMAEGAHLVRASDGIILYANPRFEEMFGYGTGELNGKHVSVLNNSSDKANDKLVDEVFESLRKDNAWSGEVHNVKKDGTLFWSYVTISTIEHPEHGEVAVTVQTDITERKRAEAEKEKFRARYEGIFNGSMDSIVYSTLYGKLVDVNDSFQQLTGYTRDELLNKVYYQDLTPPEYYEAEGIKVEELIATGIPVEMEKEYIRKDGTRVPISFNAFLVRDELGKPAGLAAVIRDLTETKRADAEFLKAQKLESLGVLAGGIAHDFNNILTGIVGNISVAKASLGSDKAYARLTAAENATAHATGLAQQLLTFSKGGTPVKKISYTKNLIKDAVSFSLSGSNVMREYSIQEELWPVDIDTGQINQVISNIAINARYAMPEGGLLKVGAENITIDNNNKDAMGGLLKEGRYIKITVTDNGTGIDKEYLDKIFDPYFTTKKGGSGLGLATSYSIIKKHDGHITVESQLGAGTTFHLYLPASKELPGDKDHEEIITSLDGKRYKGMKVLVMDDEEIIRDVSGEMLTSLGYKVDFATGGNDAVELYRKAKESGEPFNAVIMDLTIPGGMGGKETIKKFLEIDPVAKVIVSSGYSNDPIMSDYKKYGFCGVIAKPYKLSELSAKIHKVIVGED